MDFDLSLFGFVLYPVYLFAVALGAWIVRRVTRGRGVRSPFLRRRLGPLRGRTYTTLRRAWDQFTHLARSEAWVRSRFVPSPPAERNRVLSPCTLVARRARAAGRKDSGIVGGL